MKTIQKFLAGAVILLLMSCGNAKNGTMSTDKTMSNDTNPTTPVRNANNTATIPEVGERSNGNRNLSLNNSTMENEDQTVNQADYDLQRTKQMYTSMNMTADQVQRYETASSTWMDSWKRDHPQGVLSNSDRLQQQNTTLKSILDVAQYQNYEQWMKMNPYRN